jgi:hypothetical protein
MPPYAVVGSPQPTSLQRIARACWDPFCDGVYYTSTVTGEHLCPFCGRTSSAPWLWTAAS